MKAVVTQVSSVIQNNTFEVTFDVYNGPNNDQLDAQNLVVFANSKDDASAKINEMLEQRRIVKEEAASIPVGFEIALT